MLAVWITGGFFTLLGAMSLAELGAAIPDAGGIYTFIARAFGPLAGFLCGWMLFTVGTSGSIATLAAALPIYIGGFLTLTPTAAKAVGIGAITFFTAVNLVDPLRAGVQNALTVLKVGGLLAMVAAIFLLPSPARPAADALPGAVGPAAFGTALVAVLWAYEGWHDVSFAAGEMRNPQRDFPLGAIGGVAIVVALYLAELAYLHVLTPGEIASSERVALTAIRRVAGETGARPHGSDPLFDPRRDERPGSRRAAGLLPDGERRPLFAGWAGFTRWRTPAEAILLQAIWSGCSSSSSAASRSSSRTSSSAAGSSMPRGRGRLVLRRKEPDCSAPSAFPAIPSFRRSSPWRPRSGREHALHDPAGIPDRPRLHRAGHPPLPAPTEDSAPFGLMPHAGSDGSGSPRLLRQYRVPFCMRRPTRPGDCLKRHLAPGTATLTQALFGHTIRSVLMQAIPAHNV